MAQGTQGRELLNVKQLPMKDKPAVHWTYPMPTPYGALIFQALHDAGFINLMVHYRRERVASHPWLSDLRRGYSSRIQQPVAGVDWWLIAEAFCNRRAIFIGGWGDMTNVVLIMLCLCLRRTYVFDADTPISQTKRNVFHRVFKACFLRLGFRRAGQAIFYAGDPRIAHRRFCNMGAPAEKLIHFPFWVDTEALISSNLRERRDISETLYFISIGRVLNNRKGHDHAIRALALAQSRNHRLKFEYRILGTGPDVANLLTLAQALGVADKVKLLGWCEPDDVRRWLWQSDILIHPSPVDEPYGVAVIEAMAAGRVVLASDVTFAALDRIEDGINGLIYRAGDPEVLATKIEWCFANAGRLRQLGHEAMKTAAQWPVSRGVNIVKETLKRCGAFGSQETNF